MSSSSTVLTEEQKQQIQRNRERALEIRRKRARDEAKTTTTSTTTTTTKTTMKMMEQDGMIMTNINKNRNMAKNKKMKQERKLVEKDGTALPAAAVAAAVSDDVDEMEDFERNASEYVTAGEAKQMYCLPEGTLAICAYVEKENPHRRGWTRMKLYQRSEIRRRSHERHGGLEGLQAERERRKTKRFQKDLEITKDLFK